MSRSPSPFPAVCRLQDREAGFLLSYYWIRYRAIREIRDWLGELGGYRPEIFVDSGAFTAWQSGKTLEIGEYARWLRVNHRRVDWYANLDQIGDPVATLRNQLILERQGLRPLPVVHYGTDPEEVRRMSQRGYAHQCLGGLVPHLSPIGVAIRSGKDHPALRWLQDVFQVAREEGVRFHGFGVTTWSLIDRFPWWSVDSTLWSNGVRYGRPSILLPTGRWVNPYRSQRRDIMAHADTIRSYGADPVSIASNDPHARAWMTTLTARSLWRWKRWKQSQGVPLHQIYLAIGSELHGQAKTISAAARMDPAVTRTER